MKNPVIAVSVAIPTYRREQVLLDTIGQLLGQEPPVAEILVLDQTSQHEVSTGECLRRWHDKGAIRWFRLKRPSQPGALNYALGVANFPIVVCLDDDIQLEPGFVASHVKHYETPDVWAVAGQVLQPGESELSEYVHRPNSSPLADINFPFSSSEPAWIENGMSGNLSLRRDKAIMVGGFDENFLPPVSFRFDSEFCKRLVRAGGKIYFEPKARIHHLRAASGGTRSRGNHLSSSSPIHGSGDYYFALTQGLAPACIAYLLRRPVREVLTRFHLKNPWYIPVKLFGEFRAFVQALRLRRKGPKYFLMR